LLFLVGDSLDPVDRFAPLSPIDMLMLVATGQDSGVRKDWESSADPTYDHDARPTFPLIGANREVLSLVDPMPAQRGFRRKNAGACVAGRLTCLQNTLGQFGRSCGREERLSLNETLSFHEPVRHMNHEIALAGLC